MQIPHLLSSSRYQEGEITRKPILLANLEPPPQNISNVFLSQQKNHNVSPTAKKIILQLLSNKTQSQKIIKNLNISFKYARYAAKFLEIILTPEGNYADDL